MMRLDKFLVQMETGSRSEVKKHIKNGLITVNGEVCKDADRKIEEEADLVASKGKVLTYSKYQYFMLHKPQGVVTATRDNHDKTVMDLLDSSIPKKDLFPVGRLDKDTEGLLLITNDGDLAHMLLSPKRHVDKTYLVHLASDIADADIELLQSGVDIGEDALTLPAKVEMMHRKEILLTLHEGKFHQVKRMLKAVNNEVIYLKRMTFGSLTLEDDLPAGAYRPLRKEEIAALYDDVNSGSAM